MVKRLIRKRKTRRYKIMAIIKFKEEVPQTVKLRFAMPKQKESVWEGVTRLQYMYGCGDDDVFFASSTLISIIQLLRKGEGDSFTVVKEVGQNKDGSEIKYFKVNGESLDDIQTRLGLTGEEVNSHSKARPSDSGLQVINDKLDKILDLLGDKKSEIPF